MAAVTELTKREKAARLFVCLGPEYSAEIYKHLNHDEVREITLAVSKVKHVDPETRDAVVNEFYTMCLAQQYILEGGIDYAREILRLVYGPENAESLVNQLSTTIQLQQKPFEFMRKAASGQLLNYIHNEHPQTIAVVLSYMLPSQAAEVISAFDPEMQANIITCIAKMGSISPDSIKRVEEILEKKVTSMGINEQSVIGGVDAIVEIVLALGRNAEKKILEILEQEDAELADDIRSKLLTFEDIVKYTNQVVQRILKEVDDADLAKSLKFSDEEIASKFFDNMSRRKAATIKDDISVLGPLRVRDVEEAQQRIVAIVRRLEEAGEIVIPRGGEGDDLLV